MYKALYVAADLYASSEVADLLAATIRPSLRGRFQDNLQMARLLGALSGHNRILCGPHKAESLLKSGGRRLFQSLSWTGI